MDRAAPSEIEKGLALSKHRHSRARPALVAPTKLTDGGYRSSSRWLIGTLLCLALSAGIAVLCFVLIPSRKAREERLKKQLANEVSQSEYDNAMESLLQLREIAPENDQWVFNQAVLEKARGNSDAANSIVDDLVDKQHPEAALWRLEQDDSRQDGQWNDEEQQRFEELVAIAATSKDEKTRVRAKQRWATNRMLRGALEEALDALEELSQLDAASSLHAASVANQLGLAERTRTLASIAKRHYTVKLQESPKDDQCRLNLSRTMLLLNEEQDAIRLLSDGFALTRQPRFQQAAGEAMVVWSKRLKASTDQAESAMARLKLVHRATQCAPSDHAVLSAVVELMTEFLGREELTKRQLREYITSGHDLESGHFMLGLLALVKRDDPGAKLHFDLAEEAGSHLATVFNNVALSALRDTRLSTDQALLFANEAIRRLPSEPRFRETRARFLMRQERYEAAIEDLLVAEEVAELQPIVHQNLALAYHALGDEVSAKRYRDD